MMKTRKSELKSYRRAWNDFSRFISAWEQTDLPQTKNPGGLGSLGRRRYTAILEQTQNRSYIGREAKALVPSALYWVEDQPMKD
jgi:hypothetical protein